MFILIESSLKDCLKLETLIKANTEKRGLKNNTKIKANTHQMFIFQLKHKLRDYSETKKTELMRNRHSSIKNFL